MQATLKRLASALRPVCKEAGVCRAGCAERVHRVPSGASRREQGAESARGTRRHSSQRSRARLVLRIVQCSVKGVFQALDLLVELIVLLQMLSLSSCTSDV